MGITNFAEIWCQVSTIKFFWLYTSTIVFSWPYASTIISMWLYAYCDEIFSIRVWVSIPVWWCPYAYGDFACMVTNMSLYIFDFNAWHQFALGCNIYQLPQIVRYYWVTYHPRMDLLWRINASPFNGCVSISNGWIYDSIGRMNILELETYEQELWYFTLICFVLGLMAGAPANVRALLLSSKGLHRKVGENVP